MNILKIVPTCILLIYSNVLFGSECESILAPSGELISTTLSVTGPRGTLNVSAIIDTGATHSIIPRSVAEGVSYESEIKSQYQTVAGKKELKSISVNKLSFMGAEFSNVKVAISEPVNIGPLKYDPIGLNSLINKRIQEQKKMPEISLIGMSELSKVKFYFENGKFTVCQ